MVSTLHRYQSDVEHHVEGKPSSFSRNSWHSALFMESDNVIMLMCLNVNNVKRSRRMLRSVSAGPSLRKHVMQIPDFSPVCSQPGPQNSSPRAHQAKAL